MKKILLMLLALLLAAALTSCSGGSGSGKETTINLDELVESISKAINDGTYGTLPNLEPEVQIKVFDTYAEVTGCVNAIGSVTVPAEYDGRPVTKIAANAFESMRNMTSIVLPESITEIGSMAFFGCVGLTSVSIPDSVKVIGDNAFYGCSALKTVSVGAGVTEIGTTAFGYCISLENINVSPANTAFSSADGVLMDAAAAALIAYPAGKTDESYAMPEGIVTVRNFAFAYAQNLKAVTVPDSVVSLGDNTFRSAAKLESITLGKGLTFIGANTFVSCTALKSIAIPEGVVSIGYLDGTTECGGSFTGCSALTDISLPSTLKSIYGQSFSECKVLRSISFAGSSAEWASVSIGEGNENLKVAAISFGK